MRSNQSIGHRKIGEKMRNWKMLQSPCQKWQGFWELQEVRFMGF